MRPSIPNSELCKTSSMVRPRTCSETSCSLICRRHRREPNEDLTSRIHTITMYELERIKDEDQNKSRLRVRGRVFLRDRSQWRWRYWISNLVKVVMHCFISICSWSVVVSCKLILCRLNVATAESGLFLAAFVCPHD